MNKLPAYEHSRRHSEHGWIPVGAGTFYCILMSDFYVVDGSKIQPEKGDKITLKTTMGPRGGVATLNKDGEIISFRIDRCDAIYDDEMYEEYKRKPITKPKRYW